MAPQIGQVAPKWPRRIAGVGPESGSRGELASRIDLESIPIEFSLIIDWFLIDLGLIINIFSFLIDFGIDFRKCFCFSLTYKHQNKILARAAEIWQDQPKDRQSLASKQR